MKRRTFISRSTATAAYVGLGSLALPSCMPTKTKHLTIVHTNDVHSHIDPFPNQHSLYPNQGGVARRASLIEKIRIENPNILLLDAGDIFQGTPYFNFYGGELEFKLMSMLHYDAATMGNHDFDNGLEGFLAQLHHAKFDFLIANYDFRNTILEGTTKPYKIFEKNKLKIGVFGLGIKLDGLVTKNLFQETKYLDPIELAQDIGCTLKEVEGCDLVVCLSHLGYSYEDSQRIDDLKLAAATAYVDVIIGGHTHTFLEAPTVVPNKLGQNVIVNQAGCFGVTLGRLDFYFDTDKGKTVDNRAITV
ncbi:metallophosphatase [Arenibacter sp. GZD96]|uniref:bifunctional metallophosphatase/5'-nucleotidase n=1 Tax=Aurantibrevibacter litoralis TaxID=3106030 RepID=UPI002AFEAD83|nr:metallophosphatase [Arenibacter sp. GZD-96]MEA1786341.1 metallophosphatase [Arenibacter sp. GZD-96]